MHNGDIYKNLLDSISDGICIVDQNGVITYWNKGAEALTGYKDSELVGRRCRGSLLMYVDGHGSSSCERGCLAIKSLKDGGAHTMEVYARHKEGYRVPVVVRTAPIKNAEGQIVGAVEEIRDNSSKVEYTHKIEDLERCALLDPLTGVMKKFGVEMNLRSVFGVMHRYGWSYGVFFVDLDDFKKINEIHGRDVGNNVLKMVAKTLTNSVRAVDVVGRWGGEEFIVIAMNVSEDHLHSIANKIRALIAQSGLSVGSEVVRVTASVCATMVLPNDTVSTLLKRIERLMEHSRSAGSDCVSVRLDA